MKTTLELPDELMRTIKIRAVNEDRKLKDVIAELLRRGLTAEESRPNNIRRKMRFPLIEGTSPARPGEDITHDRITEILGEDDVRYVERR